MIAALSRFVSKSTDKCRPFFQALKMRNNLVWSAECEEAFIQIKQYLGGIPVLAKPKMGEDLTLYLSVSEHSVSGVLVRDEATAQTLIYYISKALQEAELRYPEIKKLALALIVSARKLRPYFQSHVIMVPTSHPLLQVLQNPEVSGRLTKWAIELGEFDIKFTPRTAIKGQAVADFVAEFSYPTKVLGGEETPPGVSKRCSVDDDPTDPHNVWNMRIDGSSNVNESGAGIVLESPTGEKVRYTLRLQFPATNNEAEYEALIAELCLSKELGVRQLRVYCDS